MTEITGGPIYIYNQPMTYQFYSYGVPGNCTQAGSNLCNGFASFATPVGDRLDHEFSITPDNKLVATSTNLVVVYIHVTAAMLDVSAKPWALWKIGDSVNFPISNYATEGDVVPLTYLSSGGEIPTTVTIRKFLAGSGGWQPTNVTVNASVTSYTAMTADGHWIVQKPNGTKVKLQLETFDVAGNVAGGAKQACLRTLPMAVVNRMWSFSAPRQAQNCSATQIFVNGACQDCPADQQPDSAKAVCVQRCGPPYFLLNNACQFCDPKTGTVSADGTKCLPLCTGKDMQGRQLYKTKKGDCIACDDGSTFVQLTQRCVDKNKLFLWAVVFFNVLLVLVLKQNLVEVLKLDVTLFVIYVVYTTLSNPEKAGEGLVKGIWGAVKGIGKGIWGGFTSIF